MLTHIMGWIVAGLVIAMTMINGAVMLASPRMWFRLPSWLRANGRYKEEDCNNRAKSISIRVVGAVILIIAIMFSFLFFFE